MGREPSHSLQAVLDDDSPQIRFERELVVGSIGTLWLGRLVAGTEAGRVVLLRRMSKELFAEGEVDSLKKVAQAYAQVRHPTLVKLLGVVEQGRDLVSVSEHLDGVRLSDLQKNAIDRDQPIPATVAVRVVLDAARATLKAHRLAAELGLFPSERVFLPEGVFIAGFGGTLLTEVGVLPAIVRCRQPRGIADLIAQLSPEELDKAAASRGSPEVFSLGVLLWELLANRQLFSRESERRARDTVLQLPIEPLKHIERCGMPVPDALVEIVGTATLRRPDRRYPSVEAFAAALDALPAHFIATEHHVATVLRDQAAELMKAFHVDPSQNSLTLAFSEVPASRMSTRPPPEDGHNWDVPTFAQSRLVSSAVDGLHDALATPAGDGLDGLPMNGEAAAEPIAGVVSKDIVAADPLAAAVNASSTRPQMQHPVRNRRRLFWVTACVAILALASLAAILIRNQKKPTPTRAEVMEFNSTASLPVGDRSHLVASGVAVPTVDGSNLLADDALQPSSRAGAPKRAVQTGTPEASEASEAAVNSDALTPTQKAKSARSTYRPHQIAPYRPKGI